MDNVNVLEKRRERLIRELVENLAFLIGSVSSKGLKCEAFNLTTKIDGVTRTRHIPKDMVLLTRRLTRRHQKVKGLLKQLADVNWALLRTGQELCRYSI